MEQTERKYVYVRPAPQAGDRSATMFLDKGVVAIGFSDFDLTTHGKRDKETLDLIEKNLRRHVQERYRWENKGGKITKSLQQVRLFCGLKPGDRVLVPRPGFCFLATVIGEEGVIHSRDSRDQEMDQANQIKVQYERDESGNPRAVRRTGILDRVQRRLRWWAGFCVDLSDCAQYIEPLFSSPDSFKDWLSSASQKWIKEFIDEFLKRIQEGQTFLASGGEGLEKLVAELYRIDGWKVEMPSKNRHHYGEGDADIVATLTLDIPGHDEGFRISQLVQVKHQWGKVSDEGVKQLLDRKKSVESYAEHELVLVIADRASEDLRRSCEENDVLLIDGPSLVEWIVDSLDRLSSETKWRLGIDRLPVLLPL